MNTRRWFAHCGVLLAASCTRPGISQREVQSTPPAAVTAAPTAPVADPRAAVRSDGRLPSLASPVSYEVELNIDPSREGFTGTMTLVLNVPESTRTLVMHGRELSIDRVSLLDERGRPYAQGRASSRASAGGHGEPEELQLDFDEPIQGANVRLAIQYHAAYNRALRGLYRVQQGNRWYAFTQFEPNDARRAFPCFDEPGFKVPWTLSLVIPHALTAVANSNVRQLLPLADGHDRVMFNPTPNTSSYLIAFAVGEFDVVEHAPIELDLNGVHSSIPLRAITTHGQGALARAALDITAEHVAILSRYFNRAYPYEKLDIVGVPEFGAGAMENPGLITFREEMLLFDPARAAASTRRSVAGIIAHELAHQWFGNLVTMRWWDDLWLNEGFATWAATRVMDTWQPTLGSHIESIRGRGWAMEQDALPSARIVRQPVRSTSEAEEAFDGITYVKGASFLRMIEASLGEEPFRRGVQRYMQAHAWQNATAQDLFTALSAEGSLDVAAVAHSFLDRRGVPVVQMSIDCTAGGPPTVSVTQREWLAVGGVAQPSSPWLIPLCFRYEQSPQPVTQCTLLSQAQTSVPLRTDAQPNVRCPRWIHPNFDESAYVRYALTPPVRAMFAPAVWRTLNRATRVGLVDAAWAELRAGTLGADDYLTLIENIRGERDRLILEQVINAFASLVDDHADGATRTRLRAFAASWLRPALDALGLQPRANDTEDDKLSRKSLLSALGTVALDAPTRAACEASATSYFRDPASVPAELALTVLPIASMSADVARLDAITARLAVSTITPQERSVLQLSLVTALDPATLRNGLDRTLTDSVRRQDVIRLIRVAHGHPERRETVRVWVLAHFEAITARLTDELAMHLAGLVGDTCDASTREVWTQFFTARATRADRAERALHEGSDASRQCEALHALVAPRLLQWRAPRAARR
ncbi:MAG: M1 family metallopeptidase [Deltaproteobacteria bacterium]|nr:M1 family metallopeptidase [Deltaproteobacteria bacterium]